MPLKKDYLTRGLLVILNLILVTGGLFCLALISIFLYALLLRGYVPHAYELPLSVSLPEQLVSAASTHGGNHWLALVRWKVDLAAVEEASPAFLALQLGWIVLQPGVTLWVTWQIRKIVASVEAGMPFHRECGRRVRTIGWTILLTAAGRVCADYLGGVYARSHYSLSSGAIVPSFDFMGLLWGGAVGLMILVLAEVFEYGCDVQNDNELTV